MEVPSNVVEDLKWWERGNILTAYNPIRSFRLDWEIFSDASNSGWGVSCGNEKTHGH